MGQIWPSVLPEWGIGTSKITEKRGLNGLTVVIYKALVVTTWGQVNRWDHLIALTSWHSWLGYKSSQQLVSKSWMCCTRQKVSTAMFRREKNSKRQQKLFMWSCRWIQKQENKDGIEYLGGTEERSDYLVMALVILQRNLSFLPSEWGTDSVRRDFICSA